MNTTTATRGVTARKGVPPAPCRVARDHAGSLRRDAAGHQRTPGGVRPRDRCSAHRGAADVRVAAPIKDPRMTTPSGCSSTRRSTACSSWCSPTVRRCASRGIVRHSSLRLLNVQPVPEITAEWDMSNCNAARHSRVPDAANASPVAIGHPSSPTIGSSPSFRARSRSVGASRGSRHVRRRLKAGLSVWNNGMGDIPVNIHTVLGALAHRSTRSRRASSIARRAPSMPKRSQT